MRCTQLFSLLLAGAICAPAMSAAIWVPTNYGNGADAEVRESAPLSNRGSSTELASRVRNAANPAVDPGADPNDRNSLIYVKIDLTNALMPADGKTAFRMTYRNNNMTSARVMDTVSPNPLLRTGMAFYGLKQGLTWDESTINYVNAPGITLDGNVGTRDLNADLTFLGTKTFADVGDAGLGVPGSNWNPVGGEFRFESAALNAFVQAAIDNGQSEVTIVSHVLHNGDPVFSNLGQWINFNYLFNPKEQLTLNNDPNYDADVLDANNALGSPWSGASNANGEFSPALLLQQIPEPTAVALGLIGLAALGMRRRV